MKSTVKSIPKAPAKPKYPCLSESSIGNIVLFTAKNTGFVVHSPKIEGSGIYDTPYEIGHYRTDWVEDNFSPITSEVILSND